MLKKERMKASFLLAIFVLLSPVLSHSENRIILGHSIDPISEFSSQVLSEAYKRINFKVRFQEFPSERSLILSNIGSLDGEVNRVFGIEKQYSNLIMVPIPINYFEATVFSKKNLTIRGWDSLKRHSIAIRIGTKFAENRTKGMKVAKFPTYEKIFLLVSKDRYDICVSSRITGLLQIRKQNLTGIRALEPPLEQFKLYHYLHKKHEKLVFKIRDSLRKMQKEGVVARKRELFLRELKQK